MRIVTLIENLVYNQGLLAEHGLCLYIETGHRKILFDTGQSGNFLTNAKNLGIDITDIDTVVISHGHYDHTGGLYPFLRVNHKANVYIKKEAFNPKFNGTEKFIGIVYEPSLLTGRVAYVTQITEIDEGIYILPDIPIKNPLDTHFHNFKVSMPTGFENDEFNDELFLAIRNGQEISIVSSCSHRGITNMMDAAITCFGLPINQIIGGFHIKNCRAGQLEVIELYLDRFSIKSIGVCHCTGIEKYAELACHFKSKVFYNYTGNIIDIR